MPSSGTLGEFIVQLRLQRDKLQQAAPILANRFADALVEELTARVPGPSKHPNASGNLFRAITARTAPYRRGSYVVVGIGNKALLGERGVKSYSPEPIRAFLDWWMQEREEGRAYRAQRTAEQRVEHARQQEIARQIRAAEKAAQLEIGAARARIEAAEELVETTKKALRKTLQEYRAVAERIERYSSVYAEYLAVGRRYIQFKSGQRRPLSWITGQIAILTEKENLLRTTIKTRRDEVNYAVRQLRELRKLYAWLQ